MAVVIGTVEGTGEEKGGGDGVSHRGFRKLLVKKEITRRDGTLKNDARSFPDSQVNVWSDPAIGPRRRGGVGE